MTSIDLSLTEPVDVPTQQHTKHPSLSSSRPAPVSPSVSRRTSSRYSASSTPASPPLSQPLTTNSNNTNNRRSLVLKIRDFAFPSADLRHIGQGPDAPHNRARRGSGIQADSPSQSRRSSGWGAFKWALSGASSKVWGLGSAFSSNRRSRDENDPSSGFPTKSDFARNFNMSNDPSWEAEYGHDDEDDEDDEDEDGQYADGDYAKAYQDEDGEPTPLLPGLYRALYTFEPEGATEMALSEGQIVRVVGRGGGIGWAIAVREWVTADEKNSGTGVHALVPESYLEIVQLDAMEDDDEDDEDSLSQQEKSDSGNNVITPTASTTPIATPSTATSPGTGT